MRVLLLVSVLTLAAGLALAAAPAASAGPVGCPGVYTGVHVKLPVVGDVGMCCDLNQDPSPCYTWP